MENTNRSRDMHAHDLRPVWGLAILGGILGSLIIGLLGVYYIYSSYPLEQEYWFAVVGAGCGSFLSIPIGILAGGIAGNRIYNSLVKKNAPRPALPARRAAFWLSALLSGVSLVPIGFVFYGLGHI